MEKSCHIKQVDALSVSVDGTAAMDYILQYVFGIAPEQISADLSFSGPGWLPFDHQDIRFSLHLSHGRKFYCTAP